MLYKTEELTVRQAVKTMMTETREDPVKVRTLLIRQAATNSDIASELLRLGADQAIRNYYQSGRRVDSADNDIIPKALKRVINKDAATAKAKVLHKMFWDRYSLFGHMLLRVATAKDLRESVTKRRKMAAGLERNAAFEEDIMRLMKGQKPTTRVCDFFAPAKIIELTAKHGVFTP